MMHSKNVFLAFTVAFAVLGGACDKGAVSPTQPMLPVDEEPEQTFPIREECPDDLEAYTPRLPCEP